MKLSASITHAPVSSLGFKRVAHLFCGSRLLFKQFRALQTLVVRSGSFGVPQNNDNRIPSQKHLADEAVLIHRLRFLPALTSLGHLITHRHNTMTT